MMSHLFANGLTYLVVFGTSAMAAAGFFYLLRRGLRTGEMPLYRMVVYRDRHPNAFRGAAWLHVLIIVMIIVTPIYILWARSSGG